MKIILKSKIKNLGNIGDIVEVKDGYAKFLINEKKAVPYTNKSLEVLNDEIKDRKDKEDALVAECNKVKSKLEGKVITFKVKTGNNDKVFGSISSKQISEELSKMGFDIDKKKIDIQSDINTLGYHDVKITLHKKVVFNIRVHLEK